MAGIDIAGISEQEVVAVVQPFLYRWGRMGRVLGRAEFSGWQGQAAAVIQSHSGLLEQFRGADIASVDLSRQGSAAVTLYESLKEAVGQISAAKVLNLICPDFFPLWDNAVANAMRAELANLSGYSFDASVDPFSGEDYLRFMEGVQLFMSRHAGVISVLSSRYGQKRLKIVDACFWWMVGRPLFVVF